MAQPNLSFLMSAGHDLGTVFMEQIQINASVSQLSLPLTSSTGNFGVSFKGKKRIITIQGGMDGTGYTGATTDLKLKDFVFEIEEVVNKGITTPFYFYDSLGNNYLVYCIDFTWTRSQTDPLRLLYSMIFIQVGTISDLSNQ